MKVTDFKTAIKQHLDNLAETDELFAKTYAKKNKSLDECVKYIYSEVQKQSKGKQCVGVSSEDVFQLAVHYYDEDDIKVDGSIKPVVSTSPVPPTEEDKKPKKTVKKTSKKASKKTDDDGFEEFSLSIPLF